MALNNSSFAWTSLGCAIVKDRNDSMSRVNALVHGRVAGILTSPRTPADSAAVSARSRWAAPDKPTKDWRPDLSAWFAPHE